MDDYIELNSLVQKIKQIHSFVLPLASPVNPEQKIIDIKFSALRWETDKLTERKKTRLKDAVLNSIGAWQKGRGKIMPNNILPK